jgi:hypothetical protein
VADGPGIGGRVQPVGDPNNVSSGWLAKKKHQRLMGLPLGDDDGLPTVCSRVEHQLDKSASIHSGSQETRRAAS